ncbi:MAG: PLDc N-terminal domain-containing protein [Anaerolineae bacterium]|nr:PLDc N-terminal domain-containing protein [Anaerolineae bacterium]
MSKQKHWQDLTSPQKTAIILLSFFQFALLVAALWDIRQRSAEQINGSKRLWTLAAFVNFVGPLAYFIFGRK